MDDSKRKYFFEKFKKKFFETLENNKLKNLSELKKLKIQSSKNNSDVKDIVEHLIIYNSPDLFNAMLSILTEYDRNGKLTYRKKKDIGCLKIGICTYLIYKLHKLSEKIKNDGNKFFERVCSKIFDRIYDEKLFIYLENENLLDIIYEFCLVVYVDSLLYEECDIEGNTYVPRFLYNLKRYYEYDKEIIFRNLKYFEMLSKDIEEQIEDIIFRGISQEPYLLEYFDKIVDKLCKNLTSEIETYKNKDLSILYQ